MLLFARHATFIIQTAAFVQVSKDALCAAIQLCCMSTVVWIRAHRDLTPKETVQLEGLAMLANHIVGLARTKILAMFALTKSITIMAIVFTSVPLVPFLMVTMQQERSARHVNPTAMRAPVLLPVPIVETASTFMVQIV